MVKKVVVFDFDKTLTYRDTVLDYYVEIARKDDTFLFKLMVYISFMILFKLNLITNDYLKLKGFNLFIKGRTTEYLENRAKKFAKDIRFNNLYKSYNFSNEKERIIVISASYEIYLKYIFPSNVEIVGTTFYSRNGIAEGFKYNSFSVRKLLLLQSKGISAIACFYTDSYSDKCLAEISHEIFIVSQDQLVKCESIDDFNAYFK